MTEMSGRPGERIMKMNTTLGLDCCSAQEIAYSEVVSAFISDPQDGHSLRGLQPQTMLGEKKKQLGSRNIFAISLTIYRGHLDLSAQSPQRVSKGVPGASRPWGPKKSENNRKLTLFQVSLMS